MPGYIASIAINSRIVLKASTVSTSFMMVWPVSRSIAPWMLRRSRPLLLLYRDRHLLRRPATNRPHRVGGVHRIGRDHRFIGGKVVQLVFDCLMKAACFAGSSLREIAVGLRCSMPSRCSSAISPDRVWYSIPHSRAIHAPIARVERGKLRRSRLSAGLAAPQPAGSCRLHGRSSRDPRSHLPDTADTRSGPCPCRRNSTLDMASQLMPSSSSTSAFARRARRCAAEPSAPAQSGRGAIRRPGSQRGSSIKQNRLSGAWQALSPDFRGSQGIQ